MLSVMDTTNDLEWAQKRVAALLARLRRLLALGVRL